MSTTDGPLPVADSDVPEQPVGRVNLRPPGTDDINGSWSLRAILIGLLALAVMIVVLLIVLNGVFEPLPA